MKSSKRIRLDPDELLEFEESLSEYPFMGVPFGAVLNDLLVIEFLNSGGRWSFVSMGKDTARLALRSLAVVAPSRGTVDGRFLERQSGKVMCTLIAGKSHLRELVVPVVRQLGPSRVFTIVSKQSLGDLLPKDTSFIARRDIPSAPARSWYPQYLRVARGWTKKTRDLCRKRKLPRRILFRIHETLLLAADRFASYRDLIEKTRPAVVLTEYDRSAFTAPLIMAANSLGIPTVTMVHGMLNTPYGYTPLVADHILAWGQVGRRQLVEFGVEENRIQIVGCPAISRHFSQVPEVAKGSLGIPEDAKIVLLATNPIEHEARRQLVREFCEAFRRDDAVYPVVRIHPSESLSFYAAERSEFSWVRFLENSEWTGEEALSLADVVVVHNSGFGLEALVKNRAVVVLDSIEVPLLGAQSLVDDAGVPIAESSDQLRQVVRQILDEGAFQCELQRRASRFVVQAFDAFGEEAAKRTADTVIGIANRPKGR